MSKVVTPQSSQTWQKWDVRWSQLCRSRSTRFTRGLWTLSWSSLKMRTSQSYTSSTIRSEGSRTFFAWIKWSRCVAATRNRQFQCLIWPQITTKLVKLWTVTLLWPTLQRLRLETTYERTRPWCMGSLKEQLARSQLSIEVASYPTQALCSLVITWWAVVWVRAGLRIVEA